MTAPNVAVLRDRYELIERVGSGGQGDVWFAHDHQHDRHVAIKVRRIRSHDEREAVLSEARILLSLKPHPGVTLVREDFFDGDNYYLVMDWIDGPSLADKADELSYDELVGVLSDVAAALDHLHAHSPPIVHQDVKPSNIVIGSDGRGVLVDFGVARLHDRDVISTSGTPAYLSPEVACGEVPSPASDVFALAASAYSVLTRSLPEPGADPDVRRIPEDIRGRAIVALEAGLCVDPSGRPARAGTFVEALSAGPHLRFASIMDVTLAYQVIGRGDVDLFVGPTPRGPWSPEEARFFGTLAARTRCLCAEAPPLEGTVMAMEADVRDPEAAANFWTTLGPEFIRTIADHARSDRAVVVTGGEIGPVAISYAVQYPDRVAGLVLIDSFARCISDEDYPSGVPLERYEDQREGLITRWGSGGIQDAFRLIFELDGYEPATERWALRERELGRGVVMAEFLMDLYIGLDVRALLPRVAVPTLVIQHDGPFPVAWGEYLAEHIPQAELKLFPGYRSFPIFPESDEVAQAITTFVDSIRSSAAPGNA